MLKKFNLFISLFFWYPFTILSCSEIVENNIKIKGKSLDNVPKEDQLNKVQQSKPLSSKEREQLRVAAAKCDGGNTMDKHSKSALQKKRKLV